MDKISINLIPVQLETLKKDQAKKKILNRVSVTLLVIMIGLSSTILSLELFQRLNLSKSENDLKGIKNEISSYHDKEALIFVLKNRLTTVLSIVNRDSSQSQAYNLITSLMPSDVTLLSFSVNKGGQVALSGDTSSILSLNTFFNNLTDPVSNHGGVLGAKVENLNRVQSGKINFDLVITLSNESNPQKTGPKT